MAGLTRQEQIDLGLLIGGGLAVGLAAAGFRLVIEQLAIPFWLYQGLYVLAVVYVGVLALVLVRSNTRVGRIGLTALTVAFLVGVAIRPVTMAPIEYAIAAAMALVVFAGGLFYARFFALTVVPMVAVAGVIGLVFTGYAITYVVLVAIWSGPLVVAVGVVPIAIMAEGYRRLLGRELRKASSGRQVPGVIQRLM